jgi:hypothetical protein
MRRTSALGTAMAMGVVLTTAACTAGPGDDSPVPDQHVLTRSTNDALALLTKSPPLHGYRARPIASGHDRSDDKGREISQKLRGRALFQIVCSGRGKVTVTMPRQNLSRLVSCGEAAANFPFRGELRALVVGQVNSTGAYAWRVLAAS